LVAIKFFLNSIIMVTKPELDRAMAELWSRMENSQAENNRVQMEAIRAQMAQDHQMFMEQLQGHRVQLDQ
jgi:hypothetical protein